MNKTEKYYVDLYRHICWNGNYENQGVQYFYGRPSQEKIDIEMSILEKMHEEKGWVYKVLCGNVFVFTCAYLIEDKNGDLYLKVFTKTKEYKIPYLEG